MKDANLLSLVSAFKTLEKKTFDNYLKYHSISFRENEFEILNNLVSSFLKLRPNHKIFENYFIGFTIPQISKEFDLLRIGISSIVNIELKNSSTLEKTEKQLIRNHYYLNFSQKDILLYTFIKDQNKLYTLSNEKKIIESNIQDLISVLNNQKTIPIDDIKQLFKVTEYLVSPFNSTEKFIKGEYFLTSQQEEIKKNVIQKLNSTKGSILAIKGSAGTGKTLLTYDIANEVKKTETVLIIHCGYLNQGQIYLLNKCSWDIISIADIETINLNKYKLIIIDEAQRIYPYQLSDILEQSKMGHISCILSYDANQTLSSQEIKRKFEANLISELSDKPFELTKKIRTNKEVVSFIQNLIYKNSKIEAYNYQKIEIHFFNKISNVNQFLAVKKKSEWKLINFTPTRSILPYDKYIIEEEDNAHKVIGQEFDNVVAVIDTYFYYKNGVLSTKSYTNRPHYHPTKMLYQIMTRARCKLCVVIINNPEVLERCLEILNTKES